MIKTANNYSLTLVQPVLDLKIGMGIYKNFSFQLSAKFKKYSIGHYNTLSNTDIGVFRNILWTFQLPFEIKYKFELNDQFSIVPNLGLDYCRITNQYTNFSSNEIGPEFSTTENFSANISNNFFLYKLGSDIEYKLLKSHSILFEFNYFYGAKELYSQKIDYNITGDPSHYSAEIISKGNYFSFGFGYRFYLKVK